jgi:hypothetical protein
MSDSPAGFSGSSKFLAKLVSYIFHPLLVGVYMAVYMIYLNPIFFNYTDPKTRLLSLATIVNNNFVFPVIVVLLLKGLGFIQSIYLNTQKERIVPYIACITFFFWTWYVFYNRADVAQPVKDMLQGVFYASIIGMVCNIYFKISMHAIGMGGLIGMMLMVLFDGTMQSGLPFMAAILFSGLVVTSRLIVSDHQRGDMMAGFLAGLISQVLAATIL